MGKKRIKRERFSIIITSLTDARKKPFVFSITRRKLIFVICTALVIVTASVTAAVFTSSQAISTSAEADELKTHSDKQAVLLSLYSEQITELKQFRYMNGIDSKGIKAIYRESQWVYNQAGIVIPTSSVEQAKYCYNNDYVIAKKDLRPGDLVFWSKKSCDCGRWREIHHAGIYIGNNKTIEASSRRGRVIIRSLWSGSEWKLAFFARPFTEDAAAAVSESSLKEPNDKEKEES